MCGITGLLLAKATDTVDKTEKILLRMRDRMVHRGPDDGGTWRDGRCFLGHRRLSIIDLSPAGHQPMADDRGEVIVVFNGEIYNHAEVRPELEAKGYRYRGHSDTETLLYAYMEWGIDAFRRFNGMWAVAIYDRRNRSRPVLHLIRDRIGVKPLYVTRTTRGDWAFASEIKALLEHPDVPRAMDLTALWHYLTFIVAPAPLTLFKNIFKLPAGWRMSIDHAGRARAEQWWDCKPDPRAIMDPKEVSEDECADLLLSSLRRSIKRRMVCDVPFGVLLSGGVDSSLNVALMSEQMNRPVTTFSIGYEGEDDSNEFRYARRVAERYKTDHHETSINRAQMQEFLPALVETQDEPIADNVCIPLNFLCKLVRDSGTTVVQVGEGSDENLLGYWWCEHYRGKYETLYRPARQGAVRPPLLARMFGKTEPAVLPAASSREDQDIIARARAGQELFWGGAACWWNHMRVQLTPRPDAFRDTVECPIEGLLDPSHAELDSHSVVRHYLQRFDGKLPEPEVLYKIPYMELKLRLPEHLLMRVDKFSMAHSIEARVPFLDYEVVELAQRIPAAYKLKDGVGKHILKKIALPFIDHDLVHRKKQGFGAPMEQWFKQGDFGSQCLAAFERSELAKGNYFDNDYVRGLFASQMGSGGGWSFHLWTIMNAVFWHERWIGNRA